MSKIIATISRTVLMLILFSMQVLTLNAQSTGKDMGPSECWSCPKASNTQPVTNNTNNTTSQPSAADLAQQQRINESLTANNKGIDYWNKQDWANALTAFQEAVDKNPGNQTLKDNLYKAQQNLLAQQQEQLRIQQQEQQERQNKAAVLKMQQSVQAFTQTLNTVPSTGGLNFDGKTADPSANKTGNANALAFMPPTSNPRQTTTTTGLQFGDPNIVDGQNVPSGLPKATDDAIAGAYKNAPAGVSGWVGKGFQAVMTKDWKVAKASFQAALLLDPGNQGLQKFIALCDYTPGVQTAQNSSPQKLPVPAGATYVPTSDEIKAYLENSRAVDQIEKNPFVVIPNPASAFSDKFRKYISSLNEEEMKKFLSIQLPENEDMELLFDVTIPVVSVVKTKQPAPPKIIYKSSKDKIQN